ncbi:MAG: hypothetical protein P1S60_20245, partial [Anaerolineae bacterium]|nr:hypothetical protein [Anaerolineae bacterium]
EFQTSKIRSQHNLLNQRETAIGQLRGYNEGYLPYSAVFDVETTAKFFALTDVWGANHALQWHNLRYYYNPITAKLEPIAFDTQPLGDGSWVEMVLLEGLRQTIESNEPALQNAYVKALEKYTSPVYLEQLKRTYESSRLSYQDALSPEYENAVDENGNSALEPPWGTLSLRQQALREVLRPLQMTYAHISISPSETPVLHIGNFLDFPVEITELQVGENSFPIKPEWVRDAETGDKKIYFFDNDHNTLVLKPLDTQSTHISYLSLTIPDDTIYFTATEPISISFSTRIWGLSTSQQQPVLSHYPDTLTNGVMPDIPTVTQALGEHSFLELADEPSMLRVKPGTWHVQQDLVLPEDFGLEVTAGTTLAFAQHTILLSQGPLLITGTPMNPVTLTAAERTWSGIVVMKAMKESHWSNVWIQSTETIERNGWMLTGGVTFYRSPVHISDSVFQASKGEDALNIIRSQFTIEGTTFTGADSDAFDGDFVQGVIRNCRFNDIAGDAIDVSGSDLVVEDVMMDDIG